MNGNRASGLRKGYPGPSLHDGTDADQKGIEPKGDFRRVLSNEPELSTISTLFYIFYIFYNIYRFYIYMYAIFFFYRKYR